MESFMHSHARNWTQQSSPQKTLVISRQFDAGTRRKPGSGSGDPFGDKNEDRRLSGVSMNKRGSQSLSMSQGQSQQSQGKSQSQLYGTTPTTTAATRPKPRKRTTTAVQPIEQSPPPPGHPSSSSQRKPKEDVSAMVAKWNKVSQQDGQSESDEDDTLGIDFSHARARSEGGTMKSGSGKVRSQGRKIKLILSPESRTSTLPPRSTAYNSTNHASSSSRKNTKKHASPSNDDDDDDDDEEPYLLLSQDHQIPSSLVRPRRNLLAEVILGTGDGDSLVADESDPEQRSYPTSAVGPGFPTSAQKKLPPSPVPVPVPFRGINQGRRTSIGYSSDEDGGVRDDSFDLLFGRSQLLGDDDGGGGKSAQSQKKSGKAAHRERLGKGKTTAVQQGYANGNGKAGGKGNKKIEVVDHLPVPTSYTNGKSKSGSGSGSKSTSTTTSTLHAKSNSHPLKSNPKQKSRPLASSLGTTHKGKAKSRGKVIVSASESSDEADEESDDSEPRLRFDRRRPPAAAAAADDDSERTPRPKKRGVVPGTRKTESAKHHASSTRIDRSPERRKATSAGKAGGVSGRKRKRGEMRESDSNDDALVSDDDEVERTSVRRRKIAGRDDGGSAQKTARETPPRKKKATRAAAVVTTTPPAKKTGTTTTTTKNKEPRKIALPEGFPSPMRAPVRPNEQLLSSPTSAPSREEEKQERPADVGPNGAQMLPVFECVPADVPTLQLPLEKVPQLVARNIVDEKCPYCDEFLPARMSESVFHLFSQLRATDAPHRTNTASSDADWTRTIEFCQRHHAESHVFPLGFHAGYPHEMNFSLLKTRVKALKPDVKKMLKRPKDSPFYLFAKRDLEQQGRRKWTSTESTNDEKRKDRLLPGYFGPLGKITIGNVLKGMLRTPRFKRLTTSEAIDPLLPEEYVDHVLVIEVALLLISQDMQQATEDGDPFSEEEKRARALQILKESREYGRRRFGIGSEYIAQEDWGNGITQMVIAEVRGLNNDSEEEESDDDQPTSSEAEPEPGPELARQQQRHSSLDGLDDESSAGNRATRSSPQRIDDDDEDVDMIRPASATPEVLRIESSPVRSFEARNSKSPILAADSDDGTVLGSTPRPRKDARQGNNPFATTYVQDSDEEFDDPIVTLDAQSVIDAANEVEATFNQEDPRSTAPGATTLAAAPQKRAAPKFVEIVDVTSPPSRTGFQSSGLRSSREAARASTSSTGPPSKRKYNLNGVDVVHDLDGDDPMDGNIGRQHQNLMQRTQTRPGSTGGLGQSGARLPGGTYPSRSAGRDGLANGLPVRVNPNGYTPPTSGSRRSELQMISNDSSNSSPYHLNNNTRIGAPRIGLSKTSGAAATVAGRAPHSAGSSSAGGPDRGRAGGDSRRGGGSGGGGGGGANLFHRKGKQALERSRQDNAVWDKKNGR